MASSEGNCEPDLFPFARMVALPPYPFLPCEPKMFSAREKKHLWLRVLRAFFSAAHGAFSLSPRNPPRRINWSHVPTWNKSLRMEHPLFSEGTMELFDRKSCSTQRGPWPKCYRVLRRGSGSPKCGPKQLCSESQGSQIPRAGKKRGEKSRGLPCFPPAQVASWHNGAGSSPR